jgi:DNA-binding protein HU-beta
MTKKDFIEKYAAKNKISKKTAGEFIDSFLETVEETLVAGESVQFVGWGSFELHSKNARKGRNPKTGEEVEIPAKTVVKFRAGKKLKEI